MPKCSEMPEMVTLPPCPDFLVGDKWGGGESDEQPVYAAAVEPFAISRSTITNRQFLEFLNDIADMRDENGKALISARTDCEEFNIRRDGHAFTCNAGFEDFPATRVSWYGANAYCRWLSVKTSLLFRLPSEVEWQYAGEGGQNLKWGLGDAFSPEDYVCGRERPEPASRGRESAFGLFNITGNVFEWCSDEYTFRLRSSETADVVKGSRVIKGGSYILSDSTNFRNSRRFSCFEGSCLSAIGFRIVRR